MGHSGASNGPKTFGLIHLIRHVLLCESNLSVGSRELNGANGGHIGRECAAFAFPILDLIQNVR